MSLKKIICGYVAALVVFAGGVVIADKSNHGSPFPASLASVASAQAPSPKPTPAPKFKAKADPISQTFVVALDGPTEISTGGFAVVVTKPADAVIRWRNELPAGSVPLELTDNAGRLVLCFFSPAPGVHRFGLSAQLPVAGLDPFAEASHVVTVGPPPVVVVPPGPVDPTKPDQPPVVDPATTTDAATAVVYVYEKDESPIPPAVLAGLNKLNRESQGKIIATLLERDTTNAKVQTPLQYQAPLAAAKEAGLPALVVMAGAKVVRVIKAPTTEAQVLEAAR